MATAEGGAAGDFFTGECVPTACLGKKQNQPHSQDSCLGALQRKSSCTPKRETYFKELAHVTVEVW